MSFPRRVRAYAYQAFYRMPGSLRRAVVILVAPKYLVGAVAVIRDSRSGDLLLLRQPSKTGWSLPAGLLKRREAPAVGAARELFEETGVRVAPDDLSPGVPNAIIHPVGVVDTVWFGTVDASQVQLHIDGGEIVDIGWFPIDALPRLTSNTVQLLSRYDMAPKPPADAPSTEQDSTPATQPTTERESTPATQPTTERESTPAARPADRQPKADRGAAEEQP